MKKNLTVLINPTNLDPPPNYFGPPYGLSLIGAALKKNRRDVKGYDFDLEPLMVMLYRVKEIIKEEKPRYFGITLQSCSRGPVYELMKVIKEADEKNVIVLGGPFATLEYKFLLNNFPVDFVVLGDGEITLTELLYCLDTNGDVNKIEGIAFRKNKKNFVTGERKKELLLDRLPLPAFEIFGDFSEKIKNGAGDDVKNFLLDKRCLSFKNALLLLSSRGCIYSCIFCPMSKIDKYKIRFHSPEYFVDMVSYFYKKYGIKNYIFGDNFFTLIRKRVLQICDLILKKEIGISWSCMTRPDYVDKLLLEKMSEAGCYEIAYGVESGSTKIQKILKKNIKLDLALKNMELTKRAGIRSNLMLMVGNLGETKKTIYETIERIKETDPDNVLVKILKVYPGTIIHDIFEKNNLLPKDYYLSYDHQPPSFTLEHTEKELKEFESLIKTRRIYIQIHNHCNNHCYFCAKKNPKKEKDFFQLKKEIFYASRRGEHVILTGGEPLLRDDIFKLFEYADFLDIHHLYLYSNARVFSYQTIAKKISCVKSLRKILVPFFGLPDFHDKIAQTENAFEQSIEGIRNLKKYSHDLKIKANIYITKSNIYELLNLVSLILNAGIDEFNFIFFKDQLIETQVSPQELPSMKESGAILEKIAKLLNITGIIWRVIGLPFCVLEQNFEHAYELSYLFDETIKINGKINRCRELRIMDKMKFRSCLKCRFNALCEGVWKKYAQTFGNAEFKSI